MKFTYVLIYNLDILEMYNFTQVERNCHLVSYNKNFKIMSLINLPIEKYMFYIRRRIAKLMKLICK